MEIIHCMDGLDVLESINIIRTITMATQNNGRNKKVEKISDPSMKCHGPFREDDMP